MIDWLIHNTWIVLDLQNIQCLAQTGLIEQKPIWASVKPIYSDRSIINHNHELKADNSHLLQMLSEQIN